MWVFASLFTVTPNLSCCGLAKQCLVFSLMGVTSVAPPVPRSAELLWGLINCHVGVADGFVVH